eukprot:TRINITY_DN6509_c0_g1_i1.p2 TRINITY_DN6509_c0_g1~~TRINITY_DN6509_c0_g1_i1.p2  ORF type:complete len:229 (-),score=29.03 TRINITY_DN6509_c0_g1_i1:240-926(-)
MQKQRLATKLFASGSRVGWLLNPAVLNSQLESECAKQGWQIQQQRWQNLMRPDLNKIKWKKPFVGHPWRWKNTGDGLWMMKDFRYGKYGLKALAPCLLRDKHIEVMRRVFTRHLKKEGEMWLRVFPFVPITRKPQGARMGKGKGKVDHFAYRVRAGQLLMEFDGMPFEDVVIAAKVAGCKLPTPVTAINKLDATTFVREKVDLTIHQYEQDSWAHDPNWPPGNKHWNY